MRRQYRADPQALGQVLVADAERRADSAVRRSRRIEHARGPAMISSENGLLLATVLLNVQGRDVGGFVDEAQRDGRRAMSSLPAGYYVGWSGRWENQEHARAAAADRAADRAARHLRPPLLHLPLTARSGARAAGRAVRARPAASTCCGCSATTSRSRCGWASSRCSARPCRPAS